MAAVLYKWESKLKNGNENKQYENIEEIINNADEQTVKKFLYDIISNNEVIRLRFLNTVNKNNNKTTLNEYKNLVDSTIDEHCGHGGYIDYYGASDFIDDWQILLTMLKYKLKKENIEMLLSCLITFALRQKRVKWTIQTADFHIYLKYTLICGM